MCKPAWLVTALAYEDTQGPCAAYDFQSMVSTAELSELFKSHRVLGSAPGKPSAEEGVKQFLPGFNQIPWNPDKIRIKSG